MRLRWFYTCDNQETTMQFKKTKAKEKEGASRFATSAFQVAG